MPAHGCYSANAQHRVYSTEQQMAKWARRTFRELALRLRVCEYARFARKHCTVPFRA